jgi:hypothetical protein
VQIFGVAELKASLAKIPRPGSDSIAMPESVESMPATDNDAGGLPEESNESESLSVADVAAEGISVMVAQHVAHSCTQLLVVVTVGWSLLCVAWGCIR